MVNVRIASMLFPYFGKSLFRNTRQRACMARIVSRVLRGRRCAMYVGKRSRRDGG